MLVGGILWSIPETSKFRAIGDEILLVGGILWSIPETSKFRAMSDEILLVGGIPLGNRAGRATSSRTSLSSRRFFQKSSLTRSVAPPFRKRSRLLRLCPCKRGHNASAALPNFCGVCLRYNHSKNIYFVNGKQIKTAATLVVIFISCTCRKNAPGAPEIGKRTTLRPGAIFYRSFC